MAKKMKKTGFFLKNLLQNEKRYAIIQKIEMNKKEV